MSRLLCYATKNFLYFEMKYLRNVHCEYTKKKSIIGDNSYYNDIFCFSFFTFHLFPYDHIYLLSS